MRALISALRQGFGGDGKGKSTRAPARRAPAAPRCTRCGCPLRSSEEFSRHVELGDHRREAQR